MAQKVKGFLFEPKETFDSTKEDSLTEAMKYYLINAIIFSALFAFISRLACALFNSMVDSRQNDVYSCSSRRRGTSNICGIFDYWVCWNIPIGYCPSYFRVYMWWKKRSQEYNKSCYLLRNSEIVVGLDSLYKLHRSVVVIGSYHIRNSGVS